MKEKNKQSGFTLVELAIVLVIIGLLIGGILVAQSMITTTKIQSFVRQIGQYDSALANFEDKFSSLPGDSVAFSGGNGDGAIESAAGSSVIYNGELPDVWQDLSATGLKSEQGAAFSGSDSDVDLAGADPDLPKAKIGNTIGILLAYDDSATAADSGHFYYVGDFSETDATNIDYNLAITGNDALAIDTKLDDGDSDAGTVYADDLAADDATADTGGLAMLNDAACPASYTVGSTAAYVMRIRVGTTTGALK